MLYNDVVETRSPRNAARRDVEERDCMLIEEEKLQTFVKKFDVLQGVVADVTNGLSRAEELVDTVLQRTLRLSLAKKKKGFCDSEQDRERWRRTRDGSFWRSVGSMAYTVSGAFGIHFLLHPYQSHNTGFKLRV